MKRMLQRSGTRRSPWPLCDLSIKHDAKVLPIEGAAALRYQAIVKSVRDVKFTWSNLCNMRDDFAMRSQWKQRKREMGGFSMFSGKASCIRLNDGIMQRQFAYKHNLILAVWMGENREP